MHSIYVRDILRICQGKLFCGDENLELVDFCTDTRKINEGDVYVGICGERVDGNDFYKEAIRKGATCLILSKEPDQKVDYVTIVIVEDTIKCLQELAGYKRDLYSIPVVAITGSVGKTSTKDIIYSVVSEKYNTHKTIGNYNNHIGVPLTILGLKDHEVLVVEMGMNHFNEISLLSKIAKPTIGVITNIGTSHIGNLGSREGILKAKLELLDGMAGKNLVINQDDDMLSSVLDDLKVKYNVSTVSIDTNGTYKATNMVIDAFSSQFDIDGITKDININVGGRAYIYNSLIAYAIGRILDINDQDIKKGIASFSLSSNRLEKKITKNGITLIDDTYNANYDSMKSSIDLLGKVKNKRKVAILGDMLELGDYTNDLHTKLGDVIIDNKIDILVTIGESSKLIGNRAIELGMDKDRVFSFEKENDSYIFLDNLLNRDDMVLIKGSHGIHMIGIVDYLMK